MHMSDAMHEIRRLMNEYCYSIDRGDLDGFADLFANGSFEVIGDPAGPAIGAEAVRNFLKQVTLYDGKTHAKHVLSNVQIDVGENGETAVAESYITVYQALRPDFPLQAIFIGHYHDRFEKVDGNWQFTSRRISPDLIGDLSRHRADMA
jgi:hypothetical protein